MGFKWQLLFDIVVGIVTIVSAVGSMQEGVEKTYNGAKGLFDSDSDDDDDTNSQNVNDGNDSGKSDSEKEL